MATSTATVPAVDNGTAVVPDPTSAVLGAIVDDLRSRADVFAEVANSAGMPAKAKIELNGVVRGLRMAADAVVTRNVSR